MFPTLIPPNTFFPGKMVSHFQMLSYKLFVFPTAFLIKMINHSDGKTDPREKRWLLNCNKLWLSLWWSDTLFVMPCDLICVLGPKGRPIDHWICIWSKMPNEINIKKPFPYYYDFLRDTLQSGGADIMHNWWAGKWPNKLDPPRRPTLNNVK